MSAIKCIIYFAIIGIIAFVTGRLLPKRMFKKGKYPYRQFSFEKNGEIYERMSVKTWQKFFLDMSKLFPGLITKREMVSRPEKEVVEDMLMETCVAEVIHVGLLLFGFGAVFIWKGLGGVVASILYFLGNLPYIIIQRYERPRLERLSERMQRETVK